MKNVNFRVSECEELYLKMEEYHRKQEESFETGLKNIRQLLTGGEGFHANLTNEKVLLVLEMLESQIAPQLTQLFADGELACRKMLEKALAEDSQG